MKVNLRPLALVALFSFLLTACSGGLVPIGEGGGGGGGGGTPIIQAPTKAEVLLGLQVGNTYCMVAGHPWTSVVFPECTAENVTDLAYSLEDLPAWLQFDSSTLTISLVDGYSVIPDHYLPIEVTYSCYSAADPTISDSVQFVINNCDDDGLIDVTEFAHGEVPLLHDQIGYIVLKPVTIDTYRPRYETGTGRKIPNAMAAISTGLSPTDASDDIADFDGDGLTNLQEITDDTNIFVAQSDADLTASEYINSNLTVSAGSGDFNNDGLPDIVVGTSNGVSVYLWNPATGIFDVGIDTATPLTWIRSISVADFDSDGNMDLAATEQPPLGGADALVVMFGDGTGNFPTIQNVDPNLNTPTSVAAFDFNGDDDIDIAMTHWGDDTLRIYIQDDAGQLALENTYPAGNNPEDVICADFDVDNILDLAVVSSASESISVFLGNGDGSFTLTAGSPYDFGGTEPWALTSADFNNDGSLDIAAINSNTDFRIFWGVGNGNFSGRSDYALGNARDVAAADLDGDNDIDIVTYTSASLTIGLNTFKATGTVNFDVTDYPVGPGILINRVVAADFGNDGMIDIATTSDAAVPVLVFMQQ